MKIDLETKAGTGQNEAQVGQGASTVPHFGKRKVCDQKLGCAYFRTISTSKIRFAGTQTVDVGGVGVLGTEGGIPVWLSGKGESRVTLIPRFEAWT